MYNIRLLVLEVCVQRDTVALLGRAEKEPAKMCYIREETALGATKPHSRALCALPHPSRHADPILGIMHAALPGKFLCQPSAVKFFSRSLFYVGHWETFLLRRSGGAVAQLPREESGHVPGNTQGQDSEHSDRAVGVLAHCRAVEIAGL